MKKTLAVFAVLMFVLMFATSAGAAVPISSNAITMDVQDGIVITVDPISTNLYETETLVLTVAALGDSPTYQWRKGGLDLAGEITATLTIVGALAADSGSYDCVVSNGVSSATSAAATVIIYIQPTVLITVVPPDTLGVLNIATGAAATYTATVTPFGLDPAPSLITYQWQKGGLDIFPETANTLAFAVLANPGDDGVYTCVVTCTAP